MELERFVVDNPERDADGAGSGQGLVIGDLGPTLVAVDPAEGPLGRPARKREGPLGRPDDVRMSRAWPTGTILISQVLGSHRL
jgi:hypothetical protein